MKKTLAIALVAGLGSMTAIATADTGGSSSDGGNWDVGNDFSSNIDIAVDEVIKEVTVRVNMEHSWVGDVTATISNGITSVDLIPTSLSDSSNLGTDTSGFDDLVPAWYTFSDGGAQTIAAAALGGGSDFEIAPGTYLADSSLDAAFGGMSTAGTWTLSLSDSATGDDGNIDGWSIEFVSNIPAPGSAMLLGAGGLVMARRRR